MSDTATEIKLITDHRFVWINYDAKGKTLAEGGGNTASFNGTDLLEHLDYADKDEKFLLNGKDQVLVVTFDNATFTSGSTLKHRSEDHRSLEADELVKPVFLKSVAATVWRLSKDAPVAYSHSDPIHRMWSRPWSHSVEDGTKIA